MHERLRGIPAFVDTVEAGSFAAAAKRSGVTRSAVAKAIAKLEQRLGVRLFQRTTRQLSLTDDGHAYYEYCTRAIAELADAEAMFETGRREPAGRLRISAPVLFGRQCVAPVVLELTRRYALLDVEMSFSDRVVDLIDEGIDLAIRIGRLADSTSLAARRLGMQRMGICASPGYLAQHGHPAGIAELKDHTGIVYGRHGQVAPWRVRGNDGKVHECLPASRLCYDDLQAIADAAVAGAGLAWLPCWLIAPHIRDATLSMIMDSELVLATDVYAVWPATRYLPSKVRATIDALVGEIPRVLGPLNA
jgi:DNA-binding transcriptional LysR family regulator